MTEIKKTPDGIEIPPPGPHDVLYEKGDFLERILLTHFDVVRSRFIVLSMPNAVSKLPFRAAGDFTAAG